MGPEILISLHFYEEYIFHVSKKFNELSVRIWGIGILLIHMDMRLRALRDIQGVISINQVVRRYQFGY